MKSFLKFVVLLAAICSLIIACGSDDAKYTITFESNGGSTVENQIVEKGKTATRPANDPTKTNFEFDNWYSDAALTTVYDFSSRVTAHITLYAKWIGNPFTVTFNNDPGSGGPTSIEVRYGSPMFELPVNSQPIQVGFCFTGYWDAETGGTKYYNGDFSSAKDWDKASDAALYAQWEPLPQIEMIQIPAGTFTMGKPESEPAQNTDEIQREVTLSSFYMSKYLVTQEEYEAIIGRNPSDFDGIRPGKETLPGQIQGKRPVDTVSWYDAILFCNRLSIMAGFTPAYSIKGSTNPADWGRVPTTIDPEWNAVEIVSGSTGYRLPTEAQWEYACRAGTTTAFNWGRDQITDEDANYLANGPSYNGSPQGIAPYATTQVGIYPPNNWGLYDMHGNLWDHCWDWYGPYAIGPQTDPLGPPTMGLGPARIWRGGAWLSTAQELRSAFRGQRVPTYRSQCFGIRIVRP